MDEIEVVCLCQHYDMKEFYGHGFAAKAPWIKLKFPHEVKDPLRIRHALAFSPADQDFAPYGNLELVSSGGAGVDAILSNPSLPADVAVSRIIVPEQAQSMASFAVWHIVNWQRQMQSYPAQQREANWNIINRTPPSNFPVGILGFGKIGSQLAAPLRLLGYPVTVLATSEREIEDGTVVVTGDEGLGEIIQNSRAIVNLLPLTEQTEGILNADTFAQMRDDAIVINLGRGGHLIEDDLLDALEKGRPAAAALDTFATEPLPTDHPFWKHDKVFVTPHVAGDADADDVAVFIAEGIRQFEAGKNPAGLVDRATGY
ncbi:Glyoxylate/hydroxypyruvate reductase A [Roseovarius albus]|uniref:Glyoxylate/hydroxypyruvate reductase A n=1 Tax=Roseovarius albus TaxID=1247867 RepID=A0A1X6YHJ3_9RHOB|nr:NAD(P)-dependent oxidoreductase [Roseovarius albus]SLN21608.1 Glyoxylate/hydroxypyruvate reductase A [Roseovarius albus]